jgi:hypothetical protein
VATEIQDAMRRVEDRKRAALEGFGVGGNEATEEQGRLVVSGSDLDFDEIREVQRIVAETFVIGAVQGYNAAALAGAVFTDGVLVGLAIAEARTKAEVSS